MRCTIAAGSHQRSMNACIYMYVCMYVCKYVCMIGFASADFVTLKISPQACKFLDGLVPSKMAQFASQPTPLGL